MRGRSLGSPLYNSGAPSLSPYSNEAAPGGNALALARFVEGGGHPPGLRCLCTKRFGALEAKRSSEGAGAES